MAPLLIAGRTALVAAGLAIAAFASLLSFGMAGAGHGWVTPMLFSLALFPAYPVVLLRLTATGPKWRRADLVIVWLGGIADVLLLLATVQEGTQYFWRVMEAGGLFVMLWLLIWFGWQALAVRCLIRDGEEEQAGFG